MKRNILLIFFFILVIILSYNSFALSITPTVKDVEYSPGSTHSATFYVWDVEELEVSLGGQLEPYSRLLTPVLMTGCLDRCEIIVETTLPDLSHNPGRNTLDISVSPPLSDIAGVGANVKLSTSVRVLVPYPGKYLEAMIEPSANYVEEGEKVLITAYFKSYGGVTIEEIKGSIWVYSVGGEDDEYFLDLGTFNNLGPGEENSLSIVWDTAGVKPGLYSFLADLFYDGGAKAKAKYFDFKVGKELVMVKELSTSSVISGSIQEIFFNVVSYWNEDLDYYVVAELKDSSDEVVAEGVSKSFVAKSSGSRVTSNLFLDLTNVGPGEYPLFLTTFFAGGLSNIQEFSLGVIEEVIIEKEVQEISGVDVNKEDKNSLILIVIIVLVILAVFSFFKFRKSKNGFLDKSVPNDDF